VLLAAGTTLATLAAAFLAPTPIRGLASAIALAVLIGAVLQRRGMENTAQLRVTPEGQILARFGSSTDSRPMQALFCAPWLIVLGDRRTALAVWPDGLSEIEFRRLAVASRWVRPVAEA
jgi:hypothetical protein